MQDFFIKIFAHTDIKPQKLTFKKERENFNKQFVVHIINFNAIDPETTLKLSGFLSNDDGKLIIFYWEGLCVY